MTSDKNGFDMLMGLMRRLRAPGGCPWDAEQTHENLKRYLLEETYEVIEAIDAGSVPMMKEELGDLLLQVVFHSVIAEEAGEFDIDGVIETLNDKLIRRHPHVFANLEVKNIDQLIDNWEKIKKKEKGEARKSVLSGVPPHLPALLRAHKISEKAARVGFDWSRVDEVFAKVLEELKEFEETMLEGNQERMEAELGDLLFAISNLARFLSLDAEDALRKTISRFMKRFEHIEESLHKSNREIRDASLDEMEKLWEEAKIIERESSV